MPVSISRIPKALGAGIDVPVGPEGDDIESDGEPLESEWHVLAIPLLLDVIDWHRRGRDDYFVGGNMFIYYLDKKTQKRRFRGPDFFFVDGAPRHPLRSSWRVYDESNRFPDAIIELTSPKTRKVDTSVKKDAYQNIFKTHEYFCYDPRKHALSGWRLRGKKYAPLTPDRQGRLWSEKLGMALGSWHGRYHNVTGVWLRFFTEGGVLLPTEAEARDLYAAEQAQRAHEQAQRADEEAQRAAALERELKALKATLRKGKNGNGAAK